MLVRVPFCTSFFKVWAILCACCFGSCKDFKNWKNSYSPSLIIHFEPEKDPVVPNALKNLRSEKIQKEFFVRLPHKGAHNQAFKLIGTQTIPLNPDANEVEFTIESISFCQKIKVFYERVASLISTEAGGLQQAYVIQDITFGTDTDPNDLRSPLFTKFKIEQPVLLKKDKNKHHVTLYY